MVVGDYDCSPHAMSSADLVAWNTKSWLDFWARNEGLSDRVLWLNLSLERQGINEPLQVTQVGISNAHLWHRTYFTIHFKFNPARVNVTTSKPSKLCLFLCFKNIFEKIKFYFIFLFTSNKYFLLFSYHFNVLISKIIFLKNIF
jgi:hypothetical protein